MENLHFQWVNPLYISMAMFNSYVSHYHKVYPIKSHETTIFLWFSYDFPMVFQWLTRLYVAASKQPPGDNLHQVVQALAKTNSAKLLAGMAMTIMTWGLNLPLKLFKKTLKKKKHSLPEESESNLNIL